MWTKIKYLLLVLGLVLPTIAKSDVTVVVGGAPAAAGGGGSPVSVTLLTASATTSTTDTYVTASVALPANKLIIAWISTSAGSGGAPTVTAASSSFSWVEITNCVVTDPGLDFRLTLFRALETGGASEAVTFTGSKNSGNANWGIVYFDNATTSGISGADAIVQSQTATTDTGGEAASLTVTLGAFGSTNNATFAAFFAEEATAVDLVAGSGFTEVSGSETGHTEGNSAFAEFRNDNDISVDASWDNSTEACGVAVEIKRGS